METMTPLFTRQDYDLLPEGFPAQLIEGFLVKSPAPTYGHQRFAARIRQQLVALVGPDRVPDSPADVSLDDWNVYQPDIVVLDETPEDKTNYVGTPLLAVEVLSPSSEGYDREVAAGLVSYD